LVNSNGSLTLSHFTPPSTPRSHPFILSKTAYNQRIGRAFACPITSKVKGYPFEVAISTGKISGVVLADHLKNIDWRSRNAESTGEFVSDADLQAVWQLAESIVDIY
jgi:mRNA interferase MazF